MRYERKMHIWAVLACTSANVDRQLYSQKVLTVRSRQRERVSPSGDGRMKSTVRCGAVERNWRRPLLLFSCLKANSGLWRPLSSPRQPHEAGSPQRRKTDDKKDAD